MKIDLHCHTKEYSRCGQSTEAEQIRSAIRNGLDGIVITDHNRVVSDKRLKMLNKRYAPFRIFPGVEVFIRAQEEDILVIGLNDPQLEDPNWTYDALHQFVKARGGAIAIPHPFRYKNAVDVPYEQYPPDAIEIRSSNIGQYLHATMEQFAKANHFKTITNSDSHLESNIGVFYNDFDADITSPAQLVSELIQGHYQPGIDKKRVEAYNQKILEMEARMRFYHARGKTYEAYAKDTGHRTHRWDAVISGTSFVIL